MITLRKIYQFLVRKFNELLGYTQTQQDDQELQTTSLIRVDGTLSPGAMLKAKEYINVDREQLATLNPINQESTSTSSVDI